MIPRAHDLVITRWGARYRGDFFPCSVGRGGIGKKFGEGDGITPIGTWRIVGCGFRADRVSLAAPHLGSRPIRITDIWSDDPEDPAYNHGYSARNHPFSHEALWRADPLYDVFAILDFNWPKAVPGRGSAIFLHRWRKPRHPTEGCVAFAPEVLSYILSTWTPVSRVVIR